MKFTIPDKPWTLEWHEVADVLRIPNSSNPATAAARVRSLHRQGHSEFAYWVEDTFGRRFDKRAQRLWTQQTDAMSRHVKRLVKDADER